MQQNCPLTEQNKGPAGCQLVRKHLLRPLSHMFFFRFILMPDVGKLGRQRHDTSVTSWWALFTQGVKASQDYRKREGKRGREREDGRGFEIFRQSPSLFSVFLLFLYFLSFFFLTTNMAFIVRKKKKKAKHDSTGLQSQQPRPKDCQKMRLCFQSHYAGDRGRPISINKNPAWSI